MLVFREEKSPEDEIKAWQFWHGRQHSVKQRILDAGEDYLPVFPVRVWCLIEKAMNFLWVAAQEFMQTWPSKTSRIVQNSEQRSLNSKSEFSLLQKLKGSRIWAAISSLILCTNLSTKFRSKPQAGGLSIFHAVILDFSVDLYMCVTLTSYKMRQVFFFIFMSESVTSLVPWSMCVNILGLWQPWMWNGNRFIHPLNFLDLSHII